MSGGKKSGPPQRAPRGAASEAFLLTQVGAHAAKRFAERLESLELTPPQAGILRILDARPGLSQQALAQTLAIMPSRLVVLIDELEAKQLIERRDSEGDRRVYELHLSPKGEAKLDQVGKLAKDHNEEICEPLSQSDRSHLRTLLQQIADAQKLTPGVHPGFSFRSK